MAKYPDRFPLLLRSFPAGRVAEWRRGLQPTSLLGEEPAWQTTQDKLLELKNQSRVTSAPSPSQARDSECSNELSKSAQNLFFLSDGNKHLYSRSRKGRQRERKHILPPTIPVVSLQPPHHPKGKQIWNPSDRQRATIHAIWRALKKQFLRKKWTF